MDIDFTYRGFTLDPFQVSAITEIENGHSLVLAAPTGSGKTLVAEYLIDKVLQTDKRVVYTSPIKALSSQKFRDFSRLYGDKVGILTGDVVINSGAQALIMTTEVYRNMAIEDPEAIADVSYVIFDEVHYIGDIERGTVWEESIIFSPKTVRFLALSATIPNSKELANWIESVIDHNVKVITHNERAVPLSQLFYFNHSLTNYKDFIKRLKKGGSSQPGPQPPEQHSRGRRKRGADTEKRYLDIVKILSSQDRLPLLYFVFSRALVDRLAADTARVFDFTSKKEKEHISDLFETCIDRYNLHNLETVSEMREELVRGIGRHHAGLLPQLKEVVEILFAERVLRVLYVTETFAVGVNMPARTVAYDALKKFDGRSFRSMNTLEFCQISGRAGRRGIDKTGWVVVPHLPQDLNLEELEELVYGDIQELKSQFDLSFNSVLNLYAGHKNDEVRRILKKNFAQFQANKHLPKLISRVSQYRSDLERVGPRCVEKKNDLDSFMAFHKKKQETINSIHKQMYNTKGGMRGRRDRQQYHQVKNEYGQSFDHLEEQEKTFICGNCPNKGKCISKFYAAAKVEKKLEFWHKQLEEQEELQLPVYEKKLRILRELGYIDDKGLLPRGEFAARIHIEELAVTELYFRGVFQEWDHHEINALIMSLVYEHRRRGGDARTGASLRDLPNLRDAKRFVAGLTRRYDFIKPLDTHLAPVMHQWSTGASFEVLTAGTDVAEGDLIRAFRQAIDLIRQIRDAVQEHSLRDKLTQCLDHINRDLVLATELRD